MVMNPLQRVTKPLGLSLINQSSSISALPVLLPLFRYFFIVHSSISALLALLQTEFTSRILIISPLFLVIHLSLRPTFTNWRRYRNSKRTSIDLAVNFWNAGLRCIRRGINITSLIDRPHRVFTEVGFDFPKSVVHRTVHQEILWANALTTPVRKSLG